MYLFKASGETYMKVVNNRVHAFQRLPAGLREHELVFLSRNREGLRPGEKQIRYVGKVARVETATPRRLEKLYPSVGAGERWEYLVYLYSVLKVIPAFDLNEVTGFNAARYRNAQVPVRFDASDEAAMLRFLTRALVGDDGDVLLYGRFIKMEGLRPVRLVDGVKVPRGCRVHAAWQSLQYPVPPIGIGFRMVGQLRYFDPKKWRPTIVNEIDYEAPREGLETEHLGSGGFRVNDLGYRGESPDMPWGSPEADLVPDYVSRIGDDVKFWTQQRLEPEGLHTDLFDRTFWRLFEAKFLSGRKSDRCILREAVGQLLDYKRFFPRRPSIGVLLPEKPTPRDRRYFDDLGVVVVWQTPSGQFRDSADGIWTLDRLR